MAHLSMQAVIDHGRITVAEPDKLPVTGKALLTVLDLSEYRPDWDTVMRLLDTSRKKIDGMTVEREARNDWDERERKQWNNP